MKSSSLIRIGMLMLVWTMLSSFVHPFYVSIIQIDHNASASSLEMTFKIFTDDLEKAIQDQGTDLLRLGTEKEHAKSDAYIQKYISNNFDVSVDGKPLQLNWVGKEVEYDITWCYMEASGVATPKQFDVVARLLTETYSSQTNIVHVKVGGLEQSEALNKTYNKISFKY